MSRPLRRAAMLWLLGGAGVALAACGGGTVSSSDQGRADARSVGDARADADGATECSGPEQCASRNCQQGRCVDALPSCDDGVRNGLESDVDCGGPRCAGCALGARCTEPEDCTSQVCAGGLCASAPATCNDGEQNGGESDVDCGQVCPTRCAAGLRCAAADDCASGRCAPAGTCAAPACDDGVKNGDETDVDCGGSCPTKCADGQACASDADCASGECAARGWCLSAACEDGAKNGDETDVDCGGSCAAKCVDGQVCKVGADCASGACPNGVCATPPPTCGDGAKNGDETDVDCGGSCAEKCAAGQACKVGADCQSRCCDGSACGACGELLVEAESFTTLGGWKVDSQFVELMGSAYLLAHGLGQPVADASTQVTFPHAGEYRLWVRTKDWVPPHKPGTFKVAVAGQTLVPLHGTRTGWGWEDGGMVTIGPLDVTVKLVDQTGFDGRCDALYFAQDPLATPPDDSATLLGWRRTLLGVPDPPPAAGSFDLVVVGGGIAGASATLAAARRGLSVALIHDRPFVGGNASQEVRVHTCGYHGEGFAAEIVDALDWDNACEAEPAGSDNAVSYDAKRLQVLGAEANAKLFLEHRAVHVEVAGGAIQSVDAVSTRTGQLQRFSAPLFVDATGDGWIGYWAGASFRSGREAQSEFGESLAPAAADQTKLGSSVLWKSVDTGSPTTFPDVSAWTADVVKGHHAVAGDWTWEYGIVPGLSTIDQAEEIRDHLLRAAYGAFYNAHASHGAGTRKLSWVAYVAGKRESRRLVGDLLLKEQDLRGRVAYPDTIVVGSWPIDLHYPNPCWGPCCPSCLGGCRAACSCAACGPACELDFISRCEQTHVFKYGVPYRSLYSKNIANLLLAGRDISVTHVALGGTRVQNTHGQMGAAVAVAASLCKQHNTTPRGVYQSHLAELIKATTGVSQPLGPLLRNGYVQSNGAKSWSQTCELSGAGAQDCTVDAFSSWSLPPTGITPDAGTQISDRYAFVYRVNGQRKLRNGFVQSDGAKSWSQTCDIDGAGTTSNCGGFTSYGPPAGITPDAGQSLSARYAFVYTAGGVQKLRNGFVQSDGAKSWSQTCDLDSATGTTSNCTAFSMWTLPPAGVTPDAGTFISDRYAFVYRVDGVQKLRNGFMQSNGAKSWSQTCDLDSGTGVVSNCSAFSQYGGPPAGVTPDAGSTANRRYVFTIDPY